MPGFEGTGPQGRGPMTGKAGGYCLMKMPDASGEPTTGFAGLAGRLTEAKAADVEGPRA